MLEIVIAELADLSEADQEQIARQLLSHVEKLGRLREELDKGACSLDAGKGATFSIEEFIRQKAKWDERRRAPGNLVTARESGLIEYSAAARWGTADVPRADRA